MKILIVGGGGREHALGWRLAQSGHSIIAAPGNPGLAPLGECVAIDVLDLDELVGLARQRAVDLVVVGPEAPLVAGLADRLRAVSIDVFGPGTDGAQLEGSKSFSKQFFQRHDVRTSEFAVCVGRDEARAAAQRLGGELVVKLDGLAAGKGVIVCAGLAEVEAAIDELRERYADAAETLVIERRIRGRELSVMALCDGEHVVLLAQAEDHKQLGDGDRGPNTGGMGTVSPAGWASEALLDRIETEIFAPTVAGLRADGIEFRGVLYAGLMVDESGVPWILEYNCRFGDPETQPVMMRVRGDFGAALLAAARGELGSTTLEWDDRAAVCVVMASAGYPASSTKGVSIGGLEAIDESDAVVFQAGTATDGESLVTAGGRVLGVTALGDDVSEARIKAYRAVSQIQFDGAQYRRDIGERKTP